MYVQSSTGKGEKLDKSSRVLELYQDFLSGKAVNKQQTAERYGVDLRSVQRDIDAVRNFLAEQNKQQGVQRHIIYDRDKKAYKLVAEQLTHLTEAEMLSLCKILLESRAFPKAQMESMLQRLLNIVATVDDATAIRQYIGNEIFHYANPAHPPFPVEWLWQVAQAVQQCRLIDITYTKLQDKMTFQRRMVPVGVLFSEFYFYLLGKTVPEKPLGTAEDEPRIYRFDRIKDMTVLDEQVSIPYRERFQPGIYRNRIQYMYGGRTEKIKFKYKGLSLEAVLDRLPTAKQVQKQPDGVVVEAEVFGQGILMWLLSQGSKVEVLEPEALREAWLDEAIKMCACQKKEAENGKQV